MNHIDLFSGIGGFSKGFQDAGLPITKTYFSEVDKYAITVYKKQFPEAEYIGSVESVSTGRFKGKNTIITFGFPCQDLSIAGKRKGFDGSRSSLFFEAMRIISEIKPSIFIFENVKGFYSSNDGKDFQIALQTIADIGLYECQWQLLNTAWFLPQNRERIYFVGFTGKGSRPKVFPIRENGFRLNESDGQATAIRTLSAGGNSGGLHSNMTLLRWQNKQTGIVKDDKAPTLTSVQKDNFVSMVSKPHGFNKGDEKKLPCLRASSFEHNEFVKQNKSIRRLTPTECEKLQGFPPGWTKYGHEGQVISDSQRYKMIGNAVSVPVVKAIGNRFK